MKRLVMVPLLVLAGASSASAQLFINPFIGTTLTTPSPSADSSRMGYGVAFGTLGKIVGFDTEIAYYPEIQNSTTELKTKSLSFMADTLIGPTIKMVKVYGAIGAGNLNLNVSNLSSVVVPNAESISNNYFTFNAGVGVAGYFSSHFGAKGDVRWFKSYGFKIEDFEGAAIDFDKFDFWRATIGALIKF
jgi:hypothetical protein